jgi:anaerobic magnesium-protoporphyrin IX monomethyl ester cyclase
MKLALINPHHGFVSSTNVASPPLGLASIAAVLEKQDVKVDIFDMAVSQRKIGNEEEMCLAGTDAVGISASMTPRVPQAIAISRALKRTDRNMPVIFGGNHASFMYKQILQDCDSVDIIVLFEGESSMLEISEALSGRKKLADVKGIAYRNKDGGITVTHPAERVEDLDTLPMPARHLLPMEQYKEEGSFAGAIVSSRGCPFRCVFCSTSAFWGHKMRFNSVERVLQEIEYLVEKHHLKEINFADDIFTYNRSRIVKLCELIEKRFDIRWGCSTRVDCVDADLLGRMQKAGCTGIFFGVESASQDILDKCNKHQTVEMCKRSIGMAEKAGLNVEASFILGLPGENNETLKRDMDFILEMMPYRIIVNLLTPYPGTSIYERPEEFGIRILDNDWQYYTSAIPSAETGDLSWEDLLKTRALIQDEYSRAKKDTSEKPST